ncbi:MULTISPECIES: cysteine dioxygenase [Thermomonospora]|uniref:Cysteine dioxygenase type I n=1 Tax=Thermomonospora curvata (strain ATCC 19995 / DSM 43183 / JCM 3096 / KCTC 9072 / NBRC 15933 / NCIMB 10081 / Henssen B9) TaxID=471852 RepID=D1A3E5_THECD|nr:MULTISPECIES: cysteine dioxygenase family protein [Thermomonospora]ACY96070.1 cysteine dioxygenase type I [Thermomonospora curvata DSM 43183]PKK15933.1 MAG: cysteine dioxygenase [Thermomonospora sp. CIF 1]
MTLSTPIAPAHLRPAEIARTLAAAPQEWIHRVRLNIPERWYERLHHDEHHEVWLLSWMPGQSTGLHDHGGSRGAFAVALGSLDEYDLHTRRTLTVGQFREFGADHIHEVANTTQAPAVSVHVYSPPLTSMNRYDLTPAGRLVRLAVERADQW